ncbi:hypothetical protein J2S74_001864 [Evansella vedderi]|uniref:DUF3231 family protein n=1 Tax=Evansella vedderi TaxID=38282 RepID=A0ABT9ZWG7_9BACI|nr:DUF3231 family protein [Evansella vedderi]MDQ0254485.1 hypothetical protein [Evansella vedderi]
MPNPFEAFWNTLKTMTDNDPKLPLHVGEVMAFWTYLTAIKEMLRYEEVGLNSTTDDEVHEMLNDAYKLCDSQSDRLETFLIKEGIPLPELSSPKPNSSPKDIPPGVKITDNELANGVSIKIAVAIVECATGQAQSTRSDVGMIWAEFQSEMLTFSATLKSLMRKRGWLKIPPYYYPSGEKKS